MEQFKNGSEKPRTGDYQPTPPGKKLTTEDIPQIKEKIQKAYDAWQATPDGTEEKRQLQGKYFAYKNVLAKLEGHDKEAKQLEKLAVATVVEEETPLQRLRRDMRAASEHPHTKYIMGYYDEKWDNATIFDYPDLKNEYEEMERKWETLPPYSQERKNWGRLRIHRQQQLAELKVMRHKAYLAWKEEWEKGREKYVPESASNGDNQTNQRNGGSRIVSGNVGVGD